jgi:hypothetical protein
MTPRAIEARLFDIVEAIGIVRAEVEGIHLDLRSR